ncbi:MAG: glycosyltransferase [Lachnospiraceae bacterium]|nr:glycosyltransferase [Lachnospiraceae bacterium]
MPEISVIVPVYKVEPFLRRCVDSILNQTFQDFELILVDDGSPDNCPIICDEYAKSDKRITVIHQENRGQSVARNAGIKKVLSEDISQWVVFIDSDDMVREDYLEKLIGCANDMGTKLVICSFSLVSEDNDPLPLNLENPIPFGCLTAEEALNRLQKSNGWMWSVPWNKIYHRSLLSENYFPVGINHEDEFIIAPLLWNAKKIGCIGENLYVYTYMRKDSITGSKLLKSKLDKMDVLFERCKFYESIGMKDLISYNKNGYLNLLQECKKEFGINKRKQNDFQRFLNARKNFLRMPELTIKDKIKWLFL